MFITTVVVVVVVKTKPATNSTARKQTNLDSLSYLKLVFSHLLLVQYWEANLYTNNTSNE